MKWAGASLDPIDARLLAQSGDSGRAEYPSRADSLRGFGEGNQSCHNTSQPSPNGAPGGPRGLSAQRGIPNLMATVLTVVKFADMEPWARAWLEDAVAHYKQGQARIGRHGEARPGMARLG